MPIKDCVCLAEKKRLSRVLGLEHDPCALSSSPGIVRLAMKNDYRIDVDKTFTRHPYAREILSRLSGGGYESVLIGGVVRDAMRSMLDLSVLFSLDEVILLYPRFHRRCGASFAIAISSAWPRKSAMACCSAFAGRATHSLRITSGVAL